MSPKLRKPENEDITTPKKPANRRIDRGVIEAVAALVSRGLTESEACRQLKIRPKSFFNFKSARRNDERFRELLEKFRASRIEDLIAAIERSAFGEGLKQRDWRAAKFLLEVLDRNRFDTAKPAVEMNINPAGQITLERMHEIMAVLQVENPASVTAEPPPLTIGAVDDPPIWAKESAVCNG